MFPGRDRAGAAPTPRSPRRRNEERSRPAQTLCTTHPASADTAGWASGQRSSRDCGPRVCVGSAGMSTSVGRRVLRALDSYASLLVLLLANFFLLELVDDPRWGAIGSTLLAAAALVVAISDPENGHTINRTQTLSIVGCVGLSFLVFTGDSASLLGLAYLLPATLLVTATLPITLYRVL